MTFRGIRIIDNKDKTLHFDCECGSLHHIVRFNTSIEVWDATEGKVVNPDLYIDYHLNQYRPWWQRVFIAIKYIFNKSSRYGSWDSTLFNYESTLKLKEFIDEHIQSIDKVVQETGGKVL